MTSAYFWYVYIRRYDWAATFVQARYRGYRIRKLYRSSGKNRRRKKRDKDMSADMLLLRMSTAGDVSTATLVQKEKQGGSTAGGTGMRSRFRMDPGTFARKGGGGEGDLAAQDEVKRMAKVAELSKKCLHRLTGECVGNCFDLWIEARKRAIELAEREVDAPAVEAYEKATLEMDRGEWEAAGSYFGIAIKANHPDKWECNFLR